MEANKVSNKFVQMGVGEAIKRLITVEMRYRNGAAGQEALDERDLIIEALDQFQLNIGFDCDGDGIADTVEIFEQSAASSCCRILSTDTSRRFAGKPGSTSSTKPGRAGAPALRPAAEMSSTTPKPAEALITNSSTKAQEKPLQRGNSRRKPGS